MKSLLFKAIILLSGISIVFSAKAQIVGQEAFLQGDFVEIGISQCGTYGTVAPAPTGYHPNASDDQLGFIADAGRDGWDTGTPPFCGDYFVPGDPEEGFSIEIAGQNYGNFQNACGTNQIPGTITGYSNTGGIIRVTWTGSINGLQVVQVTTLDQEDLFFTTNVTLTNTTNATLSDVYYMRNVDPDNEQLWTGSFETQNSIMFQPPAECPRSLVTATGQTTGCFLGLGTIDQRARVTFGGFLNRNAGDIWNEIGVFQTGGNIADQAISVAFNLGDIGPGESEAIVFAYILSSEDLETTLPLPPVPPVSVNNLDISNTNLFKGCINEPANISIADGGNFTWTWSPLTDIDVISESGNTITIVPTASRTYTATGVNNCGQEVIKEIFIEVSSKPDANAGADKIICAGSSTTIGGSYTWPHTYSWESVPAGFTSALVNPTVSPTETTVYRLSENNNGCIASDEVTVTVFNSEIDGPDEVCTNGVDYTFSVPGIPGASYNWWVNGSALITGGSGTNQVTVSFAWFTGGSIEVGIHLPGGAYCQLSKPLTAGSANVFVTPSSAQICAGESVTLTASGATSFTWSPSDGLDQTTGSTVVASPTVTTTYEVTPSSGGCSLPVLVTITVKPIPTMTVTPETIQICGNNAALSATGATEYTWSPAIGLNTTSGPAVVASPAESTTYTVTGTGSNGCSSEETVDVIVNCEGCNTFGGNFYELSKIDGDGTYNFGKDMDPIGDLDGDGITDIVISSKNGSGVALAEINFLNADGTVKNSVLLDYSEILTYPVVRGGDQAVSVAYLGDLDGPGGSAAAIAVGHKGDDDGYDTNANGVNSQSDRDRGAVVIVFVNNDGSIFGTQKISATQGGFTGTLNSSIVDVNQIQTLFGSTDSDNFGASVAYLGDLDGPGGSVAAIAVGAPNDDDESPEPVPPLLRDPSWRLRRNNGAVWILFLNADGTVYNNVKISDLNIPGGLPEVFRYRFGFKVEAMGDLDGPGGAQNYIMVAQPFLAPVKIIGIDASGSPISSIDLDIENPAFNGRLSESGISMANFGTMNGATADAASTMAISCPGRIFITKFDASANIISALEISPENDPALNPAVPLRYANSTAFLGDLNNDGFLEIAVGNAGSNAGISSSQTYILSSCETMEDIIDNHSVSGSGGLRVKNWFTDYSYVNLESGLKVIVAPTLVFDKLTIKNAGGSLLKVINSSGVLLYSDNQIKDEKVIDMSAYVPGMYFIQIISHEGVVVERVIKQ